MSEKIEKELRSVITGLAAHFEREAQEKNRETIEYLRKEFEHNEGLYDANVACAWCDFGKVTATPFIEKHGITEPKRKRLAEMIYGQQIPHFVRKTIERREGTACSGDKESFVIRKLKQYIITGKNQSLYAAYKDEPDKKAFWSPESFKDTDEVIEAFWKWYYVETEQPGKG